MPTKKTANPMPTKKTANPKSATKIRERRLPLVETAYPDCMKCGKQPAALDSPYCDECNSAYARSDPSKKSQEPQERKAEPSPYSHWAMPAIGPPIGPPTGPPTGPLPDHPALKDPFVLKAASTTTVATLLEERAVIDGKLAALGYIDPLAVKLSLGQHLLKAIFG